MKQRGIVGHSGGTVEGVDSRGLPIRVLVVDDEAITRKLIIQVLKSVGYEIIAEADNGLAGVEYFKTFKPDIVTLDVKMPVMDGPTTIKKILQVDPNATVVMLTNENDRDTVTELLKLGATDYIVKPVNRERILEKFRNVRTTMEERRRTRKGKESG
ncbi:MAG: response regulator [Spirochaetales bacterium]|jgi:two-component system, chemotaxis family, chemotaxis protein CheY|nr:response regulator [Spirochaetales bacterium]